MFSFLVLCFMLRLSQQQFECLKVHIFCVCRLRNGKHKNLFRMPLFWLVGTVAFFCRNANNKKRENCINKERKTWGVIKASGDDFVGFYVQTAWELCTRSLMEFNFAGFSIWLKGRSGFAWTACESNLRGKEHFVSSIFHQPDFGSARPQNSIRGRYHQHNSSFLLLARYRVSTHVPSNISRFLSSLSAPCCFNTYLMISPISLSIVHGRPHGGFNKVQHLMKFEYLPGEKFVNKWCSINWVAQ